MYDVLGPLDRIPLLVHKHSCYSARPRIQIFVSAPHSEINVPVMQAKRNVANCMRKIPAADTALKAKKSKYMRWPCEGNMLSSARNSAVK